MEKYDLIVVGSGPGGQRAAIQAAKFGKRAALVEKLEVIGGTAINTGTIPSKTMSCIFPDINIKAFTALTIA